jgi:SPP1 family predicted phage head-tail adaptor
LISRSLLIDEFRAERPVETADGMGSVTVSWSPMFTFKGRLSALSVSERMFADRATVFGEYKVYTDVNTEIREDWRLALGARHFEVKGVSLPSNLAAGHMEIAVKEIV